MKIKPYKESFSVHKLKKLSVYAAFLLLLLLLSTLAWLVLHYFENKLDLVIRLSLLGIAYSGLGVFYYLTQDWFLDNIINNLNGKKGEDYVSDILKENFDDSYTYIRNYIVPNSRIGDIDGLLVNQNEIILLEVKFFNGYFEIIDGKFYKVSKKGRYCLWKNPISQVRKQKECLLNFLKQHNLNIKVRAYVVLASGNVIRIQGQTGVYVLNKNNLIEKIKEEESHVSNFNTQSTQQVIDYLIGSKLESATT